MKQVKEDIINIAMAEWEYFGQQKIGTRNRIYQKGMQETDDGFWQRVGHYWSYLGYKKDGKDTDWPWSAAFISYIMKVAGLNHHFKYSIRHSDYINAAKNGELKYWEYKDIRKTPIEVGDIVCYARQYGVEYGKPLPDRFKSHGDIVIAVDNKSGRAYSIGGNVYNSVSKRFIRIDQKGRVIDNSKPWFCVLKNLMD